MENGERDFYFNRGAVRMLSKDDISKINVSDFGIAHFGSATAFLPGPLQATYVYLLEKVKAENVFISFDPNYRQLLFGENQPEFISRSWEFIKQADFFKVSDEEAMMITNSEDITTAAAHFLEKTNDIDNRISQLPGFYFNNSIRHENDCHLDCACALTKLIAHHSYSY